MKWYYLHFNEREIFDGADIQFVKDFISLVHNHNNPANLCLYQLKFDVQDGQVFYISTPTSLDSEVKQILRPHKVQYANCPNIRVLDLVCGNN